MQKRLTYLALAVGMIIVSLFVAGYVVNAAIISPGTQTVGLGSSGNVTVPSQASYELYFKAGHHFAMNSTGVVDVYVYVSNPSDYTGLYQSSNLNVTHLTLSITATGGVYIVLTNPGSANVTVDYRFY